jgi:pyruvate/2-oxoacid:ferredoxin oxidoreductase alpha subunit
MKSDESGPVVEIMKLTLMEGNEAIGWGALAAGCNFFAGYPITPATTIFNTMLKLLPSKEAFASRARTKSHPSAFVWVPRWRE